ncbi:unnamed protein product [Periconia digitata]|uniref:Uncharacterized protein n=1 Tax=Periconia digitata TaxID=1303443 RepID=A0A9W4XM91_9PLEO|nr:unnamed protein product [Periconia digitata]
MDTLQNLLEPVIDPEEGTPLASQKAWRSNDLLTLYFQRPSVPRSPRIDILAQVLFGKLTLPSPYHADAFVVFSQAIPSESLGFVDPKAHELSVSVGDKHFTIRQSRSLLTSNRKEGTTGAVVWKVTPLFAEWISSPDNVLTKHGCLGPESTAIGLKVVILPHALLTLLDSSELGAGVSGVVALSLGPSIRRYIATDQDYAIKLLQQNIAENLPAVSSSTSTSARTKQRSKKKTNNNRDIASQASLTNIETLELDWEEDSISSLPSLLNLNDRGVDLVIACDCIYNEALIEPLNSTCAQICRLRTSTGSQTPTICLVAQQLRSPDVFESWLKSFHAMFHVWKVPDELLAEGLRENSGFIVHLGIAR